MDENSPAGPTTLPHWLHKHILQWNTTCIPQNQSSGCTSVSFNTSGILYSRVSGRIRGYSIGIVDSFYESGGIRGSSVEDNYFDGVSITSSGTHVWSFVAGGYSRTYVLQNRLGFVGDDFSCESRHSRQGAC